MARQGYWVIIVRSAETAFRARQPEQLLPTLKQLQRTQPDAALRWFDGRRFWDNPEAAIAAARERRQADKRPKSWRPGGDHKDPRDKYKMTRDQKRARFKERQRWPDDRAAKPRGPADGDQPRGDRPRGDRPPGARPWGDKPPGDRPRGDRPPGARPWGDRPRGDRPRGDRPPGARPWGDKPRGDKPRGDKPPGARPWGDKPRGDKPRGPWRPKSEGRGSKPPKRSK